MNYREQLLKEHSKKNSLIIANTIGTNETELKKIIQIIVNDLPPLPQRASWVLAIIGKRKPELLSPYLTIFLNQIVSSKIDGIKRNLLSVFVFQNIPKKLETMLLDICYSLLLSKNETVAVKVHSMQVIANMAEKYQDIKQELKITIENQTPKSSIAFASRAKKILSNF